jgi:hypothetical protein
MKLGTLVTKENIEVSKNATRERKFESKREEVAREVADKEHVFSTVHTTLLWPLNHRERWVRRECRVNIKNSYNVLVKKKSSRKPVLRW